MNIFHDIPADVDPLKLRKRVIYSGALPEYLGSNII